MDCRWPRDYPELSSNTKSREKYDDYNSETEKTEIYFFSLILRINNKLLLTHTQVH